ncbi:MAG: hypothetical protein Q9187_005686 [Circinaria calcarea]
MACTKETVKSSGLNIWSSGAVDGAVPAVDIIAVQGLGAHPFYTWVKKTATSNGEEAKRFRDTVQFWKASKSQGTKPRSKDKGDGSIECMWPRDLLVPLFPNARIATYSYKSDWRDRDVKTNLRECAEQLLNILFQHRQHANTLVIAIHQQCYNDLGLSVAGIIFLGAPFQGSDAALFGKWLARLAGCDSTLLELLEKDSPTLYGLSRDFWGSYSDRGLVCFYEKRQADYGLLKAQIISPQSASLLGKRMMFLDTDHSGLNKFSGKDDENFALVLPEIQRMVNDGPSIVAGHHRAKDTGAMRHGNIHWMVPRPINELFTGRTDLLLRIRETLCNHTSSADKQRRFVITGLGGQGKSEICLKVASVTREEFWGVFWVDVGKPSTAKSDLIAVAKILGRSVETVSDALQVLANIKQNWLLILDNADDPDFDYQVYLPSGTQGAVIMTSRVSECRRYSPDATEALEGLENGDSQELLLKAAEVPKELWPSHASQAEEVVRLLGSHTLALLQAGAYIAQGHCHLHQYPEVYRRQRQRLLKYKPKQAQSRYCNVYATFEASADVLEQSGSQAAHDALYLLAILSMLSSSVLPFQIFEEAWNSGREVLGTSAEETSDMSAMSRSHVLRLPSFILADSNEWDAYRLVEASSLLVSLSLVARHDLDGSSGLSMHALTHVWAKDRQELAQQGDAWVAAGCVLALSRSNRHMWRTRERRLLPHIQSYLDIEIRRVLTFGTDATIIPILLQCGWALLKMRQDSRLGRVLDDMFVELKKNPEEVSAECLPLYELQARSLFNLGKSKRAVELLKQVVKIEETLAVDHPDRLASQHALARAYKSNGQVKEAVELLEQVVKITEVTLAIDHPDRVASEKTLAYYLQNV